ncbi:LysR family transcriptional regulator, partial [Escherichia coli]|uniref:LysR family transcriptional regulator n=4 Tax=Escherichia coli TaxID=562 RepID=UPI0020421032
MRMNMSDFATFFAVARNQSFRAAGDELGLSSSAISHSIKTLEQRLKIRLFNRTTRSVSLTEAGSKEGANKQVISSQADSLIKISRIWADFFPANTSNQP